MSKILTMACVFLVCACSTGKVYLQGYSEAELPMTQFALLKPTSSIWTLALDEDSSRALNASQSFSHTDYEIGLKPGRHTVLVTCYSGVAWSTESQTLVFQTDAGQKYLIKANVGGRTKHTKSWNPALVDVTDRDECWTVLAETAFGKCK